MDVTALGAFLLFLSLAVFCFGITEPRLERRRRERNWMARPKR